jgi:hypothetical protein
MPGNGIDAIQSLDVPEGFSSQPGNEARTAAIVSDGGKSRLNSGSNAPDCRLP